NPPTRSRKRGGRDGSRKLPRPCPSSRARHRRTHDRGRWRAAASSAAQSRAASRERVVAHHPGPLHSVGLPSPGLPVVQLSRRNSKSHSRISPLISIGSRLSSRCLGVKRRRLLFARPLLDALTIRLLFVE